MNFNIGSRISYQGKNYYIYLMIDSEDNYIFNFDNDISKKTIKRVGLIEDKSKYDGLHYADGTAIINESQDIAILGNNVDIYCDNIALLKAPISSSSSHNNHSYSSGGGSSSGSNGGNKKTSDTAENKPSNTDTSSSNKVEETNSNQEPTRTTDIANTNKPEASTAEPDSSSTSTVSLEQESPSPSNTPNTSTQVTSNNTAGVPSVATPDITDVDSTIIDLDNTVPSVSTPDKPDNKPLSGNTSSYRVPSVSTPDEPGTKPVKGNVSGYRVPSVSTPDQNDTKPLKVNTSGYKVPSVSTPDKTDSESSSSNSPSYGVPSIQTPDKIGNESTSNNNSGSRVPAVSTPDEVGKSLSEKFEVPSISTPDKVDETPTRVSTSGSNEAASLSLNEEPAVESSDIEIVDSPQYSNDLSGVYDSSSDSQLVVENHGDNQYTINGDDNNGNYYTEEEVLSRLVDNGCTHPSKPSSSDTAVVNTSNSFHKKKFESKMSDSSKAVLDFVRNNYNIQKNDSVDVLRKMSEAVIDNFTSLNYAAKSVDLSLLKGSFADSLKQFSTEMDDMLSKYAENLYLMSDAEILMDLFIMQSLSLEELEKNLSDKVTEYNDKLAKKPKRSDYIEERSYVDENKVVHKYKKVKSEYYTLLKAWNEEMDALSQAIKEMEEERDESVQELEDIETQLKDMGYDVKDIKPSQYLLYVLGDSSALTGPDGRRKLSDEEAAKFFGYPCAENGGFGFNFKPDAGIEIYEYQLDINGVNFTAYDVMYPEIDEQLYNFNRDNLIHYLSSLPTNVLQYARDGGTDLVFVSDCLCDKNIVVGDDGQKTGYMTNYCHGFTRDVVLVCDTPDWQADYQGNAIIHEFGHAVDKTRHINDLLSTGNYSLNSDNVLINNSTGEVDSVGCTGYVQSDVGPDAATFKTVFKASYEDLYPPQDDDNDGVIDNPIQDTDFGWQEYAAEAFKFYYSPTLKENTEQISPGLCEWMKTNIDSL